MKSNLQEVKFYLESLFKDNWTETPVHYVGQEFDGTGIDSWVNPFYTPLGGSLQGISKDITKVLGTFNVACWARNDVKAFELSDKVIEFMSENASGYNIKRFEVNDHHWDSSNIVYVYLSFDIEYYTGQCTVTINTSTYWHTHSICL